MSGKRVDVSAREPGDGLPCCTALGTLACSGVAFLLDSYSFETGTWRWGETPLNNLFIPLVLAPPFFVYLLSKLRELAIALPRAQHRRVDRRADLVPQQARLHHPCRRLSGTRQ